MTKACQIRSASRITVVVKIQPQTLNDQLQEDKTLKLQQGARSGETEESGQGNASGHDVFCCVA